MLRSVLRGKIHRATVTDANLEYEGSLTLDMDLADRAGIVPYEKVVVADITNGARFETYVIAGKRGSGTVCVNGAAAHLVTVGDLVIVMSFGLVDEKEIHSHKPTLVRVDAQNVPF